MQLFCQRKGTYNFISNSPWGLPGRTETMMGLTQCPYQILDPSLQVQSQENSIRNRNYSDVRESTKHTPKAETDGKGTDFLFHQVCSGTSKRMPLRMPDHRLREKTMEPEITHAKERKRRGNEGRKENAGCHQKGSQEEWETAKGHQERTWEEWSHICFIARRESYSWEFAGCIIFWMFLFCGWVFSKHVSDKSCSEYLSHSVLQICGVSLQGIHTLMWLLVSE